ncbi:MAG: tRNA (N(6)-L-threonylcarbamoyladenosine(37)-C(2))-methylthiotransferase [Candidatus Aenigmatarchaeota archaeon]
MKVYIETYGCALNKSDEALMMSALMSRGHRIVDTIDEADVVVVNTCTVRLDTEYKMISRIRELHKLCSETGKKLIVAGCMAKVQPYTVSLVAPSASLVSPQNAGRIHVAVESKNRVVLLEGKRERNFIGVCQGKITPIAVQEGCLGNCTFCIARYARRELVSHSIEAITSAVKKAVEQGAVEIELTGMDLGTYGLDLYRRRALPDLLRTLVSIEGNYKIRIGMINPEHFRYILDDLVDVLKTSSKVYKFLHIPLQSGSDKVLKLMGRRYSIDEYRSFVKEIKRKIPNVSIATDIIVGFPGEEEEDFECTIKVIKELEFERVHLASYSIRPLTLAASMKQINTRVKKSRMRRALEVIVTVGVKVREQYIGRVVEGFITEKTDNWIARLDNYIPVVLKTNHSASFGDLVKVFVDEATFFDLRGYVI